MGARASLQQPEPRASHAPACCSYLIIYDQGGVYADSDVACLRPMSDVLRADDGLVAVWEDFNSVAKQFAWDPLPAQVRASSSQCSAVG